MALSNLGGGEVLIRYSVDPTGAITGIKKIESATEGMAKTATKSNAEAGKSFDSLVSSTAKAATGVLALKGTLDIATASFQSFADHARLSTAAAGANLGALQAASKGLRTDMDLLRDAAKMQNSEFKASSEQMVIAQQAMVALGRKGHDLAKVHEAVLKAVTELKTDGLEELGIRIDMSGTKMDLAGDRAERMRRIYGRLGIESKDVATKQLTVGESATAAGVEFQNATDRIKTSIGALVASMAPLIKAAAELIDRIRVGGGLMGRSIMDVIENPHADEGHGQQHVALSSDEYAQATAKRMQRVMQLLKERNYAAAENLAAGRPEDARTPAPSGWTETKSSGGAAASAAAAAEKAAKEKAEKLAEYLSSSLGTGRMSDMGSPDEQLFGFLDSLGAKIGGSIDGAGGFLGQGVDDAVWEDSLENVQSYLTDYVDMVEKFGGDIGGAMKSIGEGTEESGLSKVLGSLDEFDAYVSAFNGLKDVALSTYDALVSGSMGLGEALKKASASAIGALGKEMLVHSVFEFAKGLSAAANPLTAWEAPGHFASAAKFAAGATLAGVVAAGLNGGGGGGGGVGGGAGRAAPVGGASGSGGGREQGSNVIYVIGSPYNDDSPRQRANSFKKQAAAAIGSASGADR